MERRTGLNFKLLLSVSGVVLLLMFALSAWVWTQIPADQKIPVHWGLDGKVDGYGGKFEGLLLIPLISIGLVGLFTLLPWLEPRKLNLEKSQKPYTAIWIGLLILMLGTHSLIILSALGRSVDVSMAIQILVGALFVLIGNYMGKMRSNFFMGIRTPWTLSSELSWHKTHRLGGWLFFIQGMVMMLFAVVGSSQFFIIVLLTWIVIMILTTFIYSYIVWKNDPNKQTTGRQISE